MLSLELSHHRGKYRHYCSGFKYLFLSKIFKELEYNLCDKYSSLCFEESMKNFTLEKECDCPVDCDSITYSYSLYSTPFNYDYFCSGSLKNPTPLMKGFYKEPFPKIFIRKLRMLVKNISDDTLENCKRYLKYRALVTFRLGTNDVAVTVKSKRLTFFDRLSAFGKLHV